MRDESWSRGESCGTRSCYLAYLEKLLTHLSLRSSDPQPSTAAIGSSQSPPPQWDLSLSGLLWSKTVNSHLYYGRVAEISAGSRDAGIAEANILCVEKTCPKKLIPQFRFLCFLLFLASGHKALQSGLGEGGSWEKMSPESYHFVVP